MSRGFVKALCLLISAGVFANAPPALAAQEDPRHAEEAAAKIETIAERIVAAMQDEPSDSAERRARLEALMEHSLDLAAITNFALGRHRSSLSTAERLQFEEVFGDYVVTTYARYVNQHPIHSIVIERTRQVNDSIAAVSTRVGRDEDDDLVWTWRLHSGDDGYRVVDLQTPSISLAVTYRRHIGAAFDKTDIETLLAILEDHVSAGTVVPADSAALHRLFGKSPDMATLEVQ